MRRLVLVVLASVVFAAACAGERPILEEGASREVPSVDEGPDGDGGTPEPITVRLAVPDGWSMDPAAAGPAAITDRVIADLLYEGLTRLGSDGKAEPALAQRWHVDEERTTWTFVLRSDLVDGGGASIVARDVKQSLERVAARGEVDPAALALTPISGWRDRMAGRTGGVAGITAPTEDTLVIRLDHPFESLAEVLAGPEFGVTGIGENGLLRTSGTFRRTDDPMVFAAVDADASVQKVELISVDGEPAAAVAAGDADWGVLATSFSSAGLDADIVRQPLDLQLALVARLDDESERLGVLGALEPLVLAGAVEGLIARPVPAPSSSGAAPTAVLIDVPDLLTPLGDAVAGQLGAAGIEAVSLPTSPAVFAERVASGDARVFPIVFVPGADCRGGLAQLALPGGIDDVFGAASDARAELVAAAWSEPDPAQRALFIDALERTLIEDGLLLPVGRFEARVAIGRRLDGLRHRADGTLDLAGVTLAAAG